MSVHVNAQPGYGLYLGIGPNPSWALGAMGAWL